MRPVLSIMMASLSSRTNTMLPLLLEQMKQLGSVIHETTIPNDSPGGSPDLRTRFTKYEVIGKVELIIFEDNGILTSGVKRQWLLHQATGDYVCCVDDDDEVTPDYISYLLFAARSKADVLTLNLAFHREGEMTETWKFGLYRNMRTSGLMCVNHLCAWKIDIAKQVAWDPNLGHSDDRVWFEPLFYAGLIHTQFHIDKALYKYMYSAAITSNQTLEAREKSKAYFKKGLRCFKKDRELFVEVPMKKHIGVDLLTIRDKNNKSFYISEQDRTYTHYHTIR